MRKWQIPVRAIKRADDANRLRAMLLRLAAVVLALVVGGLFFLALGFNPIEVYVSLVEGAVGTTTALRMTARLCIPLLITSLAVTLAFKMRFWNIGAEGQIGVGAIAASYVALYHDDMPRVLLLLVMAAVGFIAGGLYGAIPAYFKAKFGTNETLFTLMLNYVAFYTIQALAQGAWKDPAGMGFPKIARFSSQAQLPMVFGVHIGWIVALALVALVYWYLRCTKQGYELTVVGENENTARYAGMNVKKIVVRTMFLSAGLAGLAGMLQASGADKTLTESVANNVGFTAITVAWLANLNPLAMVVVTVLFCILTKGSDTIQSLYNIAPAAAEVFQGIILFFVLGSEFFIRYRLRFVGFKGGKVE